MMHGPEKSDPAIVAMNPANKAEQSAAESVERRAGTKGNADQQSTYRTLSRSISIGLNSSAPKLRSWHAERWLIFDCDSAHRTFVPITCF